MNHDETIFEQALGIGSPQAREEFLRSACAGDEAMLHRLQGLLRAYDRAGKFLEHARPEDGGAGAALAAASAATQTVVLPPTEKPGDRIGRYKLLQKIGEGGCGVVYMAEQEAPVRRRVALKIIKLGMDTRQVIARFEAERQALALMDHPNIAKVFDAGVTGESEIGNRKSEIPRGRPYFVMELVRGVKITEYCDEKRLTTQQRLELFTQVCRAVQHAHQKGIIHRDLKPSNILVSFNDGVAVPKVIDFGIAKATTGEPLTDKTVFTAFEQFIGTPAYMSPEQALVTSLDIDTRTDIYSLGVLLYELLTGQTPFDPKELLKAGLDEMRRTIREREPVRPSTRLSTLPGEKLSTAAQRRGLDPPKLVSQLRGDLDWIVMKCLEKDRARRYETANGLATDLQRHLNNEPVAARPPSNLYRLQKMVRRHRLVFLATTAVAAALVFGLGFSTLMFVRERDAARRASDGEKKAEREAEHSAREAGRAQRAEADAQEKLRDSYVAQAQARRWSGRVGRRIEALAALKAAAAIRPSLELRNEAIACLALSDLAVLKEWDALPNGSEFGAFEANYERYARGETNGTISVRRVEDDQELARFPAFGPPFLGMSFSPDGRFLVQFGGRSPYGLRVWDLKKSHGVLVLTNEPPRAAMFSPDGRVLAIATDIKPDYPMRIYDMDSGEVKKSFDLGSLAWGMHFHPTQSNLLATSDDGPVVRVWDWTRGSLVQSFEHCGGVKIVCWHPEGHWLSTACSDYGVHLWALATGQEIAALKGHSGVVTTVGFNRDGRLLCSSAWDGSLRLWDTAARKELLTRQMPGLVFGFADEDDRIGYGAGPGRLGILQVVAPAGYRALRPREADDVHVRSCAFNGDGRILVSSHEEHLRFWDTATGRQLVRLPGHFADATFDSGGKRLFTRNQNGVQEWEVRFSAAEHEVDLRPTRQFPLRTGEILLNHDGTLLGGPEDGGESFKLLDLLTGQFKGPFKMSAPFFAALSPAGKLAATWPRSEVTQIEVTDVASAQTVKRLPIRNSARAVFSQNGRWLATGDNTEFRLWDLQTWKPLYTVPRHFTDFWCKLAFSPDSSMLAVAHSRDVVKVLAAASGEELATLEAPEPQNINWLTFSPDGTQLAVGSDHGPIHLWDLGVLRQQLAEMKLDWELPPLPRPRSHEHARPITLTFLSVTNPPATDLPALAPRDPLLSPKLIDLSAHYNSPLRKVRRETFFHLTNDFSTLPTGAPTLGGTQFDVRGIVQLLGSELEQRNVGFPRAVRGIRVAQTCQAVHFLHATRFGERIAAGTCVGQYILRYADGLEHVIPINYGEDVRSWWRLPHQSENATRAVIAWRDDDRRGPMRLFKLTVENPRPGATVETIDFVSAMTAAAPLLVAITLE